MPRKLLEQFAFDDPVTQSRRLWRYQKGQRPYHRASPKTATRWDGHFRDPADAAKEAEIEARLQKEFEDPVNQFIEQIGYVTFPFTSTQKRLLGGYLTVLFHRSRARQHATENQLERRLDAFRALRADEERLGKLIAKFNMDGITARSGDVLTREDLQGVIDGAIERQMEGDAVQRTYLQSLETMMAFDDARMRAGDWNIVRAKGDSPFVIGDAPVVTWERTERDALIHGIGFTRPNVEVFLPISPTACLWVWPAVPRTRSIRTPTTIEINQAQAAFATEHCFTHVESAEIDSSLQPYFGYVRLGIDGFSTRHIDLTQALFEILMK